MRNIKEKATGMTWPQEAYRSAGDEDRFTIDYFNGKVGGYLLDIACACPVSGSLSYKLLSEYDWIGILVEPSNVHKENIESCYGDVEGVHFFQGAIHNTEKEMTLYERFGESVGHSSIVNRDESSKKYEVPCISINELLEKYNAPKDIDFINLDIEGSEREVLDNLNFKKYNVKLFCIENGIIYKDLMESNGYKICDSKGYQWVHGNLFYEKV